ncbi:MAG: MarR family transcriptional regulator [Sandaracinus sp.]|nr:MarR family transcriptional regulator [Sandaracinus sp.]
MSTESDEQLTDAVHAFFGAFKRWTKAKVRGEGRSASDAGALALIARMEPVPMKKLSGRLGLAKSSVTALVDRLEAEGLAERVAKPGDRRTTLVALTAAGRALVATDPEGFHREQAAMFDGLSAREREQLVDMLRRVTATVDERL